MGVIYKPFGIILGIVAGLIGKRVFSVVWTKVADEEPPEPTTRETSWPQVIFVGAVQGIIFRTTRVLVDRAGAIGWHHLTGHWPGEQRPDPDE